MTETRIFQGDCLDIMPTLEPDSVDSIVTDPPYGLSFMGKDWDHGIPGEKFWREALRVAKPGAHLLAFGGTRTYHRLACAIEDAGWEIRDCIMWVYGSGFPKSLDVSKAIDRAAGVEREVLRDNPNGRPNMVRVKASVLSPRVDAPITAPATDAARQWQGWGTALKPAWEPIIVARKPLAGTVAANVQKYGTGAINIDGCRVETGDNLNGGGYSGGTSKTMFSGLGRLQPSQFIQPQGRWPANLIHDGSEEVAGLFPANAGGGRATRGGGGSGDWNPTDKSTGKGQSIRGDGREIGFGDYGSAARFFYCAKASKADRDAGCEEFEEVRRSAMAGNVDDGDFLTGSGNPRRSTGRNHHPTVKPTDLMRYLCRLVTPPNGIVLDPFMGSGSTGKAAVAEGFRFLGIELNAEYIEIAKARIGATHD